MIINFAEHLRAFRERANLTQNEMARKLNMTQSHISKYETGRKVIDLETWVRWVRITNTEAQAAIIMFGADLFSQATQAITLIPAFIPPVEISQLFM